MEEWKRRARRALLVSLCISSSSVRGFWPFTSKRFTQNSLIDAGSLGVADAGRIVAFGDFNADQLYVLFPIRSTCVSDSNIASLDVVFLDASQTTLSLFLWDHGACSAARATRSR